MSTYVAAATSLDTSAARAAGRTSLLQFAIWIGFYVVYQVARGAADRERHATAFENGAVGDRLPAQPRTR